MAQVVKNVPAMWETQVWSLGWEEPLEKVKLPTPVFLPGEIPWTEEPRRLSPWDHKELDIGERLTLSLFSLLLLRTEKVFVLPSSCNLH